MMRRHHAAPCHHNAQVWSLSQFPAEQLTKGDHSIGLALAVEETSGRSPMECP
jgi:hypothetical protein